MKTWSDTIDPASIPDEVLHSEVGRRRQAFRSTLTGGRNGGRPRSCNCGKCALCKARAKRAKKGKA